MVYFPEVGGEFVLIHQLGPGGSWSTIEALPCTLGTLVARNEAGQVLDRRDERLCGGETWHIGGKETAPPG